MAENNLSDFLLKEYENISEAHFKTNDKISDFFKSYLTIMSIPLSIFTLLVNLEWFQNFMSDIQNGKPVYFLLGFIFLVIFALGFFIFLYIINLYLDSILYARSINGIRKYFIDQEPKMKPLTQKTYIQLPTSTVRPPYMNLPFFGPIIIAFSVINTVYLLISLWLFHFSQIGLDLSNLASLKLDTNLLDLVIWSTLGSLVLHLGCYYIFSSYREKTYLRSKYIGVDVDGVLNLHKEQFSLVLKKNTDKDLSPENITVIPVRDIEGAGLTAKDEQAVFNDLEYWTNMPKMDGADVILQKIQKSLNLKIFIFTARPWPIVTKDIRISTTKEWNKEAKEYSKKVHSTRKTLWLIILWRNIKSIFSRPFSHFFCSYLRYFFSYTLKGKAALSRITINWLYENQIPFDFILIEQANEIISDPTIEVLNRFRIAKVLRFKFFVEDDLIKARKLSNFCDYVFLIDHPYNKEDNLPNNVIRVSDWQELYQEIKKLI